jgi:hypothetical protein
MVRHDEIVRNSDVRALTRSTMKHPALLLVISAAAWPLSCGGADDTPFELTPLPDAGGDSSTPTPEPEDSGGPVACAEGCPEGKRCDPLADECVGCLFDHDCAANEQCTKEHECEALIPCVTSLDCASVSGGRTVCDEGSGFCVECVSNTDCGDNGECVDHACETFTPCTNTDDCSSGVCDETAEHCVGCLADEDCGDGEACIHQECQSVIECDSDNDCTSHGLLCDTAAGRCAQCRKHTPDCPDIYHCAEGVCTLDVCDMGQTGCQGNAIVTCNAVGDGLGNAEACGPGTACVVAGVSASCLTPEGGDGGSNVEDGGSGGGGGSGGTGGEDASTCTTVFYRDSDGDNFGDAAVTVTACSAPNGYVTNSDDCYDDNANAKPGQENYYPTDRGDGSFDYNCADGENPRWTATGSCGAFPTCSASVGWYGGTPGCGDAGNWLTACPGLTAVCDTTTEPRTQECR